jgi:hypothetical protein
MVSKRQLHMVRVGQNRICTLYMTVCMVLPLLKYPIYKYMYMVLANPKHDKTAHCVYHMSARYVITVHCVS